MRRLTALALLTLFVFSGVAAQQVLDYLIREIGYVIEGDQIVVNFTVNNGGDAVTTDETAHLFNSGGGELASEVIQPLGASQSIRTALRVSAREFTLGTSQTLCVAVGLDQLPSESLRNQFSNIGCLNVMIPTDLPTPTPEPGIVESGLNRLSTLDLSDPSTVALVAGRRGGSDHPAVGSDGHPPPALFASAEHVRLASALRRHAAGRPELDQRQTPALAAARPERYAAAALRAG